MTTGLRIARIQPPHYGHLDAIKQALDAGMDKILIGIWSAHESHTTQNPFTGEEREYMMRQMLATEKLDKYTDIYHLPDYAEDALRVQHIQDNFPLFHTVISDNPRVVENFIPLNIPIFHPMMRKNIRAADIRKALATNDQKTLTQYLAPNVLSYLNQINASQRIRNFQ